MAEGLQALTERERETLRLLLAGHDAKSTAARLGLSVHTVNERLREARRKLGVSSSRQAARLLAETEQQDPKLSADKQMRVAGWPGSGPSQERSGQASGRGRPLVWLGAGALVMLSVIALVALSSTLHTGPQTPRPQPAAIVTVANPSETPGTSLARQWLALLDNSRWGESWSQAGAAFKAGMPQASWSSTIQTLRQSLGPVTARTFRSATRTSSLPDAPDGDYEVVLFSTTFEHKPNVIEQVVVAHEPSGWKVDGYRLR